MLELEHGPILLLRVSDPVDRYGRLLRYIVRVRGGVNVKARTVTRLRYWRNLVRVLTLASRGPYSLRA